jgi:hypothetical protein
MRSTLFHAALLVMLPGIARAQSDSARLILINGADTAGVERFTRTSTLLTSEIKMSNGVFANFKAQLRPDASVERIDVSMTQGAQAMSAAFTFKGDTVLIREGANVQSLPGKAGAVPTLPMSFALFEQAIMRANAIGGATPTVWLFRMMQSRLVYGTITRIGADSVALTVDGTAPLRFKVDPKGRILGGTSGNTGAVIVRAP